MIKENYEQSIRTIESMELNYMHHCHNLSLFYRRSLPLDVFSHSYAMSPNNHIRSMLPKSFLAVRLGKRIKINANNWTRKTEATIVSTHSGCAPHLVTKKNTPSSFAQMWWIRIKLCSNGATLKSFLCLLLARCCFFFFFVHTRPLPLWCHWFSAPCTYLFIHTERKCEWDTWTMKTPLEQ